jgi:hypothetical protein
VVRAHRCADAVLQAADEAQSAKAAVIHSPTPAGEFTAARGVWLVRTSPLGHQIKSLNSRFPAMAYVPYVYALVTGVGVQVPLEHARSGAHESGAADSR